MTHFVRLRDEDTLISLWRSVTQSNGPVDLHNIDCQPFLSMKSRTDLICPSWGKSKENKRIAESCTRCSNDESNNSLITFYSSLLWTFSLNLSSRLEGNDISEICKKNLSAAMTIGRKDLVQTWSLLSLVLDKKLAPSDSMDESPWALHPFGRKMVSSLWVCFNHS